MKKANIAITIAVMLIAVITSTALAITIIVDGTRETAWNGGGSQSDPPESNIPDGVNIINAEWTNSVSDYYFLFETQGPTTWDISGASDPYLILCINNDNDTATGSTNPGTCFGSGYDRYVAISGPIPTVFVFDGNYSQITTAITQVATVGAITELSIDMASLGLDAATNCKAMPVGVYFDGQTGEPDDRVLDNADVIMNCGTPTAVTLQNATSIKDLSGLVRVTLVLIPALSLLTAGIFIYQRKQRRLL